MSSTSDAGSTSSARKIAAIIFGVLAVLFIVAGVIYLAEPAKSLPSILGHKAGSNGHHALRMAGSFIVGIVCAAMAWVSLAYKPKASAEPANTPENTPAGTNSRALPTPTRPAPGEIRSPGAGRLLGHRSPRCRPRA